MILSNISYPLMSNMDKFIFFDIQQRNKIDSHGFKIQIMQIMLQGVDVKQEDINMLVTFQAKYDT